VGRRGLYTWKDMTVLEADKDLLVKRLVQWGYLDKVYLEAPPSEEILADAVAEYQEFHGVPLDEDCRRLHRRGLNSDGQMGPATKGLMDSRFCDCPDPILPTDRGSLPPEEANWPTACRNEITVSWNFSKAPGMSAEETTGIWIKVQRDYEARFILRMPLNPEDYPRTRIYAALKALPGSTLAWSYLATGNCSSRLQQAYDSTISWSVSLATGTWKHEVGHALGMNHTPNDRNSLMYPSMNGQTTLNQTDISQMVRLGYKERTEPDPPDEPDDPPDDPTDPDDKLVRVWVRSGGQIYTKTWQPGDGVDAPEFEPF
jgi:hypothetical protein